MSEVSHILLNGTLEFKDQAQIAPDNRGMMYGDGCFETMRFYAGRFLRWDEHIQRLEDGLHYLGMDLPAASDKMMEDAVRLLEVNGLAEQDAMIRIQCWRKGGRGYFERSRASSYMIDSGSIPAERNTLDLCLAETRCIPSEALERKFKMSNGLNYIKAAQEAISNSCDDSLMLTLQGWVSETTSANIFWIKDKQVYTPSVQCDLLPGITRAMVLEILDEMKCPVQQGRFEWKDIREAEAIFATNSLREIETVASLDGQAFDHEHPMLNEIKQNFRLYKERNLSS